MNIGVDIDGVLYPWAEIANEAVMERFGVPDPGPHQHWTWLKEQLTSEQWRWLWTAEGQNVVFGQVERVYDDAVPAVNALLRAGHKIHFVTHRDPRRTALHTAAFLHLHFGGHPWAGVHVVQNGTPKRTLGRWDVFIDDKPETIYDFFDHTARTQLFAPARPWNTELAEVCDYPQVVRYVDPQEIVEWVDARV